VCLESWARADGLGVRWQPGDTWVTITGQPAAVDRGFDVSIDTRRDPDGMVFWAANHPATPPRGTCGEVAGIGALHSFVRPTSLGGVRLQASSPGLSPSQLIGAYDATPLTSRGLTGQGETIVFFEADAFSPADLSEFAGAIGDPLELEVPLGNLGKQEGESTMDLETAHEIVPSARLVDVNLLSSRFENMSTAATYETAFAFAARRWPGAIWSISLGSCESDTTIFDAADLMSMNGAVAGAEQNGTTVFASSGDTGGLECMPANDAGKPPLESWQGVSVPASLPAVTSVGGTTLSTTATGQYLAETTWTEPLLLQGSGGGLSRVFARPSWQVGPGTGGSFDPSDMRQVPDVAADANPATGNDIIEDGHVTTGGGTSLATPIWASFTALIDEYLRTRGDKALGFLNPELYRFAVTTPPFAPLHDITVGGNDFYAATTGYDMVTGLGSPDVWNLARDLASSGK
jgi:kumamolisin